MCLTWLLLCLTPRSYSRPDPRIRDDLIKMETRRATGGSLELNENEQLLDAKIYKLKLEEMATREFLPALHFFKAKHLIEASPIFSLLQKMPKGA